MNLAWEKKKRHIFVHGLKKKKEIQTTSCKLISDTRNKIQLNINLALSPAEGYTFNSTLVMAIICIGIRAVGCLTACVCVSVLVRLDLESYGIHVWWWPGGTVSCVWRQSVRVPLWSAHLWELQGNGNGNGNVNVKSIVSGKWYMHKWFSIIPKSDTHQR